MDNVRFSVQRANLTGGAGAIRKSLLQSRPVIALLVTLFSFCGATASTTWYVNLWVSPSGDGTSWETGFNTIQEGIDEASDGDTVVVAPGTYFENIHFKGKNIVLRSKVPHTPSWTIIDGSQAGPVVTFSGTEDETCVLSGFTIRNGKARDADGGGIRGGTSDHHTRATIENNTITANFGIDAFARGGGLAYCDGTIKNNTITGNTVIMPPTFPGQHSEGGGLYKCNGSIRNNAISENTADPAGEGGGLCKCEGRIENNTISGNSAAYGGGLFACGGEIVNNTIEANSSDNDGGGLYKCDGTIRSNLIIRNSAGYGGGLSACEGTILNNTIAENWAISPGGAGGGLYVCGGRICNCIIWGNTASQWAQLIGCRDVTYSCIEGWTGDGQGNIALNPRFVDPDGPDDDPNSCGDNDYRLSSDSPCVDAGDNSVLDPPGFDLDRNLRIAFGGGSLTVDVGAYEYNSVPLAAPRVRLDDGGGICLTWNSQPNDTFTVSSCVNLFAGLWLEEATIPSDGATTSWTDTTLLGHTKFYRIEAQ
jgi:hypothetical protein